MSRTGYGVTQRFAPQNLVTINVAMDVSLLEKRTQQVNNAGGGVRTAYATAPHPHTVEEYSLLFSEAVDVDDPGHRQSIRFAEGKLRTSVFSDWSHRDDSLPLPVFNGVAAASIVPGPGQTTVALAAQIGGTVNINNFGDDTFAFGDIVLWGYPRVTTGGGPTRNEVEIVRKDKNIIRASPVRLRFDDPEATLRMILGDARYAAMHVEIFANAGAQPWWTPFRVGLCLNFAGPGQGLHVLLGR